MLPTLGWPFVCIIRHYWTQKMALRHKAYSLTYPTLPKKPTSLSVTGCDKGFQYTFHILLV